MKDGGMGRSGFRKKKKQKESKRNQCVTTVRCSLTLIKAGAGVWGADWSMSLYYIVMWEVEKPTIYIAHI